MGTRLTQFRAKNYRALADLTVDLEPINVLFGPNGSGKSTLLDAIWFVKDCFERDVAFASGLRGHGIGLAYDGMKVNEAVCIGLDTEDVTYRIELPLNGGRVNEHFGEVLQGKHGEQLLLERQRNNSKAYIAWGVEATDFKNQTLHEPSKLSLGLFRNYISDPPSEALDFIQLLERIRYHSCRAFDFSSLKQRGSEAGFDTQLDDRGTNLWSVLRNMQGREAVDHRYSWILQYMKRSFPTFDGLVLEAAGPIVVYGSFLEKSRRGPIPAAGLADGHLHMLLLLTALASGSDGESGLLLLDEPDLSLHPWTLAVLSEAIRDAVTKWNKQIILATHSPVLLSQFEPHQILAAEMVEGRTQFKRLSEMQDIKDLLEDYSVGSLYMAQVVGAQVKPEEEAVGA